VTKVRSLEPGVSGIQQEKPEVGGQRSEVRGQKSEKTSLQYPEPSFSRGASLSKRRRLNQG